MANLKGKSTAEGRKAAFHLAARSNPLTLGGPRDGTKKALDLANWIGRDDAKLEVVQLMGLLPFTSMNFRYLVNHAKELYAELTGATEPEAVEPPKKEKVAPVKTENATPDTGTARRPIKRPRIKKAS